MVAYLVVAYLVVAYLVVACKDDHCGRHFLREHASNRYAPAASDRE